MGKCTTIFVAAAMICVSGDGQVARAQPTPPSQNCSLNRLVTLDMAAAADGTIVIPVTVQGRVLRFRLNAFGPGWISEKSARSLNLQAPPDTLDSSSPPPGPAVLVPTLSLIGGSQRTDITSVVLPTRDDDATVDGALGSEVLLGFDLDFDIAANQLNLFSPDHCPGKVVYWANDYAEIKMEPALRSPILRPTGKKIRVLFTPEQNFVDLFKGTLEGVDVFMSFNTSLTRSRLPLGWAHTLFKIEEPPGRGWSTPRTSEAPLVALQHKFSNLSFPGLTLRSLDVDLWDETLVNFRFDTIEIGLKKLELGLDVMRQLHLYVASKEQKFYFTGANAHK